MNRTSIIGPNPLKPNLLSAEERWEEVCRILAHALVRTRRGKRAVQQQLMDTDAGVRHLPANIGGPDSLGRCWDRLKCDQRTPPIAG